MAGYLEEGQEVQDHHQLPVRFQCRLLLGLLLGTHHPLWHCAVRDFYFKAPTFLCGNTPATLGRLEGASQCVCCFSNGVQFSQFGFFWPPPGKIPRSPWVHMGQARGGGGSTAFCLPGRDAAEGSTRRQRGKRCGWSGRRGRQTPLSPSALPFLIQNVPRPRPSPKWPQETDLPYSGYFGRHNLLLSCTAVGCFSLAAETASH